MKKMPVFFLLCFMLTQAAAQAQRKISTYLSAQYSQTVYDKTLGNNPWGTGLGLQIFLHTNTKFTPTAEFTGDLYLADDKVLRLTSDGKTIEDIGGVVNLFAGSSFRVSKNSYVSLLAGPGFINGKTYLGIKPSFGFYFSTDQKLTGKLSYTNIFNRDKITKDDFGSVSFSVGVKVF